MIEGDILHALIYPGASESVRDPSLVTLKIWMLDNLKTMPYWS
jgi:hypothetical protein